MSKKKVNKVEHINLHEIKDPSFLRNLSYAELDVLADDIRQEIIQATAKNGGHLSSNLGVVELTIAVERYFDLSKDKVIFDVGHQCYTHKILTGRPLDNLRKTNGVSGFQKMSESVYDCFDAGHSSTSISIADGFAISRDLKKENYDVVAIIGDGALPSGLSLEGLNSIASADHKVIIILNDNGMSISKPVGGLSKALGRISTAAGYNRIKYGYHKIMFKSKIGKKIYNLTSRFKSWIKSRFAEHNMFTQFGFAYLGPIDGHNIKKMTKALERTKNTKKSVVVHVCTTKGKGYKFAENDVTGSWHGVVPFKVESGEPLMTPNSITWSRVYSNLSMNIMENNKNAILISPATLVGAELENVFKSYPNRCIDVGIAEEHAATMSASLAINGMHPILSIYSTFMQRAYDEIAHDLARTGANATVLVDRAGLVGLDGETHQGIYDAAFLSTIPNVTITMASNVPEARALYEESMKNHGVFCIRYPRSRIEDAAGETINLPYGKWIKLLSSSNQKLAFVAVGPAVQHLKREIVNRGLDCTLYNAIYINPLDEEAVSDLLNYDRIVIYDPYSTQGGLVSQLTLKLSSLKFSGLISAYCIPNTFVKMATIWEQLEQFGLRVEQVIDDVT